MNFFRCCTHVFQGRKNPQSVFSPLAPLFLPLRYLSRASLSFFVRNTISVLYFSPVSLHFSRCGIKSRRSPPLPAKLSLWFLTLSAPHSASCLCHGTLSCKLLLVFKVSLLTQVKKERKKNYNSVFQSELLNRLAVFPCWPLMWCRAEGGGKHLLQLWAATTDAVTKRRAGLSNQPRSSSFLIVSLPQTSRLSHWTEKRSWIYPLLKNLPSVHKKLLDKSIPNCSWGAVNIVKTIKFYLSTAVQLLILIQCLSFNQSSLSRINSCFFIARGGQLHGEKSDHFWSPSFCQSSWTSVSKRFLLISFELKKIQA